MTIDNHSVTQFEDILNYLEEHKKAGDNVYRRVQQAVSVGGYYEDNQPDAAIISAAESTKTIPVEATRGSLRYLEKTSTIGSSIKLTSQPKNIIKSMSQKLRIKSSPN